MWLTSVMSQCGAWDDAPGWQSALDRRVDALVEAWHGVQVPVVAVSNEVGSGVVPGTRSGRLFRDQLGRLNTRISAASERVLLVVAGRALDLTAVPTPGQAPAAPVASSGPASVTLETSDVARLRSVVDLTVHDRPDPYEQDTA
jgi:hypothetical protein